MRRSHSRAMVPKEARTGVCAGVLCASICVSMRLRLAPAGRGVVRSWHAHGPLDCATGWPRGIRHECRHVDRFVKCASCFSASSCCVVAPCAVPAQSMRWCASSWATVESRVESRHVRGAAWALGHFFTGGSSDIPGTRRGRASAQRQLSPTPSHIGATSCSCLGIVRSCRARG